MSELREPFQFEGIEIPVELLRRTGAGPETFAAIARMHLAQFARHGSIEPRHRVLELASGIGRDAILLSSRIAPEGRYDGFDLDRDSIEWCRKNISSAHPNFHFHHADLHSIQYNRSGRIQPETFRFPVPDACVDRAFAQSLFTHLLPAAASRYLRETARVLKPGGLALYTCFTGTIAEILASERSPIRFLRIQRELEPGCFVHDVEIPEASVAYEIGKLERMIRESGLELAEPVVPGSWIVDRAGASEHAQDLLVLRRAAA